MEETIGWKDYVSVIGVSLVTAFTLAGAINELRKPAQVSCGVVDGIVGIGSDGDRRLSIGGKKFKMPSKYDIFKVGDEAMVVYKDRISSPVYPVHALSAKKINPPVLSARY